MGIDESKYLYRIMPLKHVVDLFQTRELYFASPNSWDDPYEKILKHKGSSYAFAQCWCTRSVSDAMWRIYSPDRMSVRIRTTRAKLEAVGARIKAETFATYRLDDVRYLSVNELNTELDSIAEELKAKFSMKRATDALFYKRNAFDYESEFRAIAFLQPHKGNQAPDCLRIRMDPHNFIDSILFDPRADEKYVEMASYFLKNGLNYQGPISRSALYRSKDIHIPDDSAI